MPIDVVSRFNKQVKPECLTQKTDDTQAEFKATGYGGFGFTAGENNKIVPGEEISTGETGLVSLWHFSEGTGTTANDSKGTNHGTIFGATWINGKLGNALKFEGNDYVDIGTYLPTDNITVEAWIRVASLAASGSIWGVADSTGWNTAILNISTAGIVRWIIDTDSSNRRYWASDFALGLNTWYHIALVQSGGPNNLPSIYVNGQPTGVTCTLEAGITSYSAQPATIGRYGGYDGLYFNGIIDEVAIYNTALSEDTIKAHYESHLTSLYRSPRWDLGVNTKPYSLTFTKTDPLPAGTDLKCFARSGSTTEVDKTETRHTKQTDFEAGLKKSDFVIGADDGTQAIYVPYGVTAIWHLNKDSMKDGDTIDDSSGKGNTGTLVTGDTDEKAVAGKLKKALLMDGIDDYVSFTTQVIPLGAKTIEFWMRTTDTAESVAIASNSGGSSSNHGTHIDLRSGKIGFTNVKGVSGDPRIRVDSVSTINDGVWHHIAVTWDGTTNTGKARIYIDGELDVTATADSLETTNASYNLCIGGYVAGDGRGAAAELDEFIIYSRELSADEIKDRYNQGNGRELPKPTTSHSFESSIIDMGEGKSFDADAVLIHSDIPTVTGFSLKMQVRSGTPVTTTYSIAGVKPKYTNPDHPGGVTGTLLYTYVSATEKNLQWRDESQPSPQEGTAVNVAAGGTFKIYDGAVTTNFIEVEVDSATLPSANATGTYTTSTWSSLTPTTPAELTTGKNKINLISASAAAGLQIDKNVAPSQRFWQYKIIGATDGTDTWIIRDVIFIPKPTNWEPLQEITTTTDIQKCKKNQFWQWMLVGATDGQNTWNVSQADLLCKFFAVDLKGTYPDMGIGCTNLKKIELASGTATDTIQTIAFSTQEKELDEWTAIDWTDVEKVTALTVSPALDPPPTSATVEADDMFQARLIRGNYIADTMLSNASIKAIAKNDLNISTAKESAGQRFKLLKEDGKTEVTISGTGEDQYYKDGTETAPLITDIRGGTATGSLKRTIKNVSDSKALTNMKMTITSVTANASSYIKFSLTDDVNTAKTIAADAATPEVPLDIGDIAVGGSKDFYFWVDAPSGAPVGTYEFKYNFYWITGE